VQFLVHGKNGSVEISENLARYRSENNLLDHQNIYVERLSVDDSNAANSFNILATSLNILHNYFDGPKLCSVSS